MSETLYSQALTFHGIGKAKARHLCALTGFGPRKRINKQVLYTFFGTFAKTRNIKLLGYNLRMMTIYHIIHLRKIKTLRGLRSAGGLPVRGQRTHANARTPAKLANMRHHIDMDVIKQRTAFDPITYKSKRKKRKKKTKTKLTNVNVTGKKSGKNKQKKKK